MDSEDKLFDLVSKMYGEMQEGLGEIRTRLNRLENEVVKTNITIEHEIRPKIDSLFDGYRQAYEKLTDIGEEVSRHEEFIIKGIK